MVITDVLVGAHPFPARITIRYELIIYTPCQDCSLSVVSATVKLTILCRTIYESIIFLVSSLLNLDRFSCRFFFEVNFKAALQI